MHNPNSNTYIIVYSTVMVVIVATLLAVASLSLQKRQAENELQEKKSNILQSLGYSPDENPQEFDRALADFDNQVKSFVLDADGVKPKLLQGGSRCSPPTRISAIITMPSVLFCFRLKTVASSFR